MMKTLSMMIAAIWMMASAPALALDLEYIRSQYGKAVDDDKLCKALIEELSKETDDIYMGYLGAFQTIWANHTLNPINKLQTFNKGRKNIEKAIKGSPENVELRFIRYSIQKNCPTFLNYRKHMTEDRTLLVQKKHSIRSVTLLSLINNIL